MHLKFSEDSLTASKHIVFVISMGNQENQMVSMFCWAAVSMFCWPKTGLHRLRAMRKLKHPKKQSF